MKIDFSPPYIDEDIRKEVLEAMDSGWITTGPKTLALEKLVAEYAAVDFANCTNSATSALMLVLHWFGVTRGDEVIIPAYTYAATALAVMHLGATPVMVDCGLDLNIDPGKIADNITPKTKAIIPVDIAGWPCDYMAIYKVVEKLASKFVATTDTQKKLNRMLVLSDAAHSIGAKYNNKPAGSLADITVFSFHAVKNLTTAEGGAICLNMPVPFDNEQIHKTLKLWSLNGQTKDAYTKTLKGGWKYDIVYPGFKMNMPDICAAIGLAQLRKYNSLLLKERKRVFDAYISAFSHHQWAELPPQDTTEKTGSYHLFALRINGIIESQRDQLIEHITETGVSVNVHFQPLPLLSVFKERGYNIKDFPVAYDNYSREISLPIYPELNQSQIEYIVKAVVNAYQLVE
ncbi:MAG: DegT/DnrJ/EryC1/StrS family aminotransferase [Cyclobacteriaceae bacterium]|nr:DegT/DnrJ/EryC1/StrS family aminotransferase [Cyclobacteriaceae bacterium]